MMPLSYISLCFLELNCLIVSFIEEVLQDQFSKHTQKSDNTLDSVSGSPRSLTVQRIRNVEPVWCVVAIDRL